MIRKSIASALLMASFVTTPALAEEPPSEPSTVPPHLVMVNATIEFGDLDLGTPAGIAELHRRTRRAAMEMCRPEPVGRRDGFCLRQALQIARPQIEQAVAARNGTMLAARNGSPRGAIGD